MSATAAYAKGYQSPNATAGNRRRWFSMDSNTEVVPAYIELGFVYYILF